MLGDRIVSRPGMRYRKRTLLQCKTFALAPSNTQESLFLFTFHQFRSTPTKQLLPTRAPVTTISSQTLCKYYCRTCVVMKEKTPLPVVLTIPSEHSNDLSSNSHAAPSAHTRTTHLHTNTVTTTCWLSTHCTLTCSPGFSVTAADAVSFTSGNDALSCTVSVFVVGLLRATW